MGVRLHASDTKLAAIQRMNTAEVRRYLGHPCHFVLKQQLLDIIPSRHSGTRAVGRVDFLLDLLHEIVREDGRELRTRHDAAEAGTKGDQGRRATSDEVDAEA